MGVMQQGKVHKVRSKVPGSGRASGSVRTVLCSMSSKTPIPLLVLLVVVVIILCELGLREERGREGSHKKLEWKFPIFSWQNP
jgi:hypothetical protein